MHIAQLLTAPQSLGVVSLVPVLHHIRPHISLAAQRRGGIAAATESTAGKRGYGLLLQQHRGLPSSSGRTVFMHRRQHMSGAAASVQEQHRTPFHGVAAASRLRSSRVLQTAEAACQLQPAAVCQLQQRRHQQTASRSNSIDMAAAPSPPLHQQQQQQPGSAGPRPALDGPASPPRGTYTHRSAARHHLQQYLAAIDTMGFVDDLAAGIWAGNRLAISRSLTLCESSRPDHALQAAALLRKLIDNNQQRKQAEQAGQQQPASRTISSTSSLQQQQQQQQPEQPRLPPEQQTAAAGAAAAASSQLPLQPGVVGTSLRVGLSGPPGAGKSSLIETWGCYLADHGSKVAVLAVDPSSVETGGAILGDKTRMARLSPHPNAFVRPSPARGTLGGVSRATYDAMVICEAAGYDKVLVETVGVGQSEVAVADLVDCMVLVMPPVGGDDLQMIKRGIMEVADIILVNKADGPTEAAATRAAAEYAGCLHLMPHRYRCWEPQVLPVSAHTGKGVPALARMVAEFQQALTASGELEQCRTRRAEAITWLNLEEQLLEGLRHDRHVKWLMARLMPWVRAGLMAPRSAADITLSYFYQHCS